MGWLNNRCLHIALLVLVVAAALALNGCSRADGAAADSTTAVLADTQGDVSLATSDPDRGRQLFASTCASCHGANLEGQPNWRHRLPNGRLPAPPHDVSGHTWHHSDRDLFDMIKRGMPEVIPGYQTDMAAYKDVLSDADIWAVLSFIESTWPAEIRARQQRMNQPKP